MGIFLRHSHLIKPERAQCGSDADVQASIFKNAERIGIDPASIAVAMPMWGHGNQQDYIKSNFLTNTGANFSGNCLSFNGSNYLTFPSTPITQVNSISVFMRVKFTSLAVSPEGNSQRLLNLAIDGGNLCCLGQDEAGAGGAIFFSIRDSDVARGRQTPQSSVQINKWHNIMVTRGIGEYAKIYIDGVQKDNANNVFSIGSEILVGAKTTLSGFSYCCMDNLIVYSQVFPTNTINILNDNPNVLFQRNAPVFYSLPGGAIIPTPRNLAGVAYSDHIVWTWEAGV